ncbi:relaxase/mobilization nuclease domain-containing protein [Chryseobacterium scophthalmum]|uniref:relaxase/mobilization nuclease domain-containing protein n=1 Tax=Chryseobacterium scophthalmum TaxID=59733 RepID=UPI001FDA06ED|nr:relaxase/mobilization nuclease domain-containing protein [Chryseobacterium scophthalmum]
MKNFPSFIGKDSGQEEVRNYLKSVSKSHKVKKPQFHAVVSTKFQEHSKEELTEIAEGFMSEMGYGSQPFIAVFHNDTDHNHIHVVSTRVDKVTGKKIDDSYERLAAQKALSAVMEKLYDTDVESELDKLLRFKTGSLSQLEILLNRNGYKLSKDRIDENSLQIMRNGVVLRTLKGDRIVFDHAKNDQRSRQIRAILSKYKEICSNKVFMVEDNRKEESKFPKGANDDIDLSKVKISFESELQKKLKDVFGIDVVFHHKDGRQPFGYTMIDYKTGRMYMGSEVLKMKDVFDFTGDKLDRKTFEILKDYSIPNTEIKKSLLEFLKIAKPELDLKDFMLFENRKRKDLMTYRKMQFEIKEAIRTKNKDIENIHFFTNPHNGKVYAIHTKYHFVGELELLIGERLFQSFLRPEEPLDPLGQEHHKSEVGEAVVEMVSEFMRSSGTGKDPGEDELKRRKRRKKRGDL